MSNLNMTKEDLLNLVRLPARLNANQASTILGFNETDIQILQRLQLLKPLGTPAPNAPKYYAACEIEMLSNDQEWLNRATRAISNHWQEKNRDRKRLTHAPRQN